MREINENTTTSVGPPCSDAGIKMPERERPPQLKRSKTSISNDTHFPGPLFPAVRRVSSASSNHPRPDLQVSVNNNHSNNYTSPTLTDSISNENYFSINDSSTINDVNNSFSDRDWMYPSFLGPHVARNRVTVKGRRGGSGGVGGGGGGGGVVQGSNKKLVVEKDKEKGRGLTSSGNSRSSSDIRVKLNEGREEGKLRVEKEEETAAAAGQVLVAQLTSVNRGGDGRWISVKGLKSSLLFSSVI